MSGKLLLFFFLFQVFSINGQENWSQDQLDLINMQCLHDRGYTGKGVTIAHLDDGCDGCDTISMFSYARENGYWKGAHDFVKDQSLEYNDLGSHGTATLSIVHGLIPDVYTGTAYDANILMARTENINSETHQEERDWRKAVDWALENGADIITSSLQYNEFDKGEANYTYESMDGNTTIITRAADYAASKGLVVVTLQGNFGASPWRYVSAPGDADSVITVGATDAKGKKAAFSGYGPSYDGRIKPDVLAMGRSTAVANPNGSISRGNGTSYAAPAIAGMLACLKQAHPERSNLQLISAVRQSGDRYRLPSAHLGLGYGIADACLADDILTEMDRSIKKKGRWISNNAIRYKIRKGKLLIKPRSRNNKIIKLVLKDIFENTLKTDIKRSLDISNLPKGDYLVDVILSDEQIKTIYFEIP